MMFALHSALAHGDSLSPGPREQSRGVGDFSLEG